MLDLGGLVVVLIPTLHMKSCEKSSKVFSSVISESLSWVTVYLQFKGCFERALFWNLAMIGDLGVLQEQR